MIAASRPSILPARFLLLATAGLFVAAQPARAQGSNSERVREIVRAAEEAMGTQADMQALPTLRIEQTGFVQRPLQSRRPEPPYERMTMRDVLTARPQAGAHVRDVSYGYSVGGFRQRLRFVSTGDSAAFVNLQQNTARPSRGGLGATSTRWLPQGVLADLRAADSTWRYVRIDTARGAARHVVAWTDENGTDRRAHFDASTHRLVRTERLNFRTSPMLGPLSETVNYAGYQRVGEKLLLPTAHVVRRNGRSYATVRWDVAQPATLDDELFDLPDLRAPERSEGPKAGTFETLGNGLHMLYGINGSRNYHTLVAEFADHLVVFDAPQGETGTEDVLAKTQARFPGQPVRAAVLSHHHDDHASGLRRYVAEGVTLITAAAHVPFIRRVAARRGLHDRQSEVQRAPQFQLMRGPRLVLEDEKQRLVLHDIGPSPHAEHLIAAYAPDAKLLFQADVLNLSPGERVAPGDVNTTVRHFAAWLRREGLGVDTLAGVHLAPRPATVMDAVQQHAPATRR